MDTKKLLAKMKWYRILFLCFAVLTVVGLIYVIAAGGNSHMEYAMVPLVIAAIFQSMYQDAVKMKKDLDEKEEQK